MRLRTKLVTIAMAATALVAFVGMPVSPASAAAASQAATSTDPVVQAQIDAILSQYVDLKTVTDGDSTTVTFTDTTGKTYEYTFLNEGLTYDEDVTGYSTTLTGWKLNKAETRELAAEGSQYALIYAIGAAMGCAACAIGAAVEAHWGTTASSAVSQGKCVWLKFWFTAAIYSGTACK